MVMTAEERKEVKRLYAAKYRAENKEKIALGAKKFRDENKEKRKADNAKYYKENKARIKIYREENKEMRKANLAKYYKENKEKSNSRGARYRATKFGATIYMTKEDKAKIDELYTIAKDATKLFGYAWAVDHIVPLNKGGLHKLSNLQVVPATWNRSKGDRNCDTYWD